LTAELPCLYKHICAGIFDNYFKRDEQNLQSEYTDDSFIELGGINDKKGGRDSLE